MILYCFLLWDIFLDSCPKSYCKGRLLIISIYFYLSWRRLSFILVSKWSRCNRRPYFLGTTVFFLWFLCATLRFKVSFEFIRTIIFMYRFVRRLCIFFLIDILDRRSHFLPTFELLLFDCRLMFLLFGCLCQELASKLRYYHQRVCFLIR